MGKKAKVTRKSKPASAGLLFLALQFGTAVLLQIKLRHYEKIMNLYKWVKGFGYVWVTLTLLLSLVVIIGTIIKTGMISSTYFLLMIVIVAPGVVALIVAGKLKKS